MYDQARHLDSVASTVAAQTSANAEREDADTITIDATFCGRLTLKRSAFMAAMGFPTDLGEAIRRSRPFQGAVERAAAEQRGDARDGAGGGADGYVAMNTLADLTNATLLAASSSAVAPGS